MTTNRHTPSGVDVAADKPAGVKPLAVDMQTASALIGVSRRCLENYAFTLRLIETRKLGKRRVVLVRSLEKFLQHDQPSSSPPKARQRETAQEVQK